MIPGLNFSDLQIIISFMLEFYPINYSSNLFQLKIFFEKLKCFVLINRYMKINAEYCKAMLQLEKNIKYSLNKYSCMKTIVVSLRSATDSCS